MRLWYLLSFIVWQAKEIITGALHEFAMTSVPGRHQSAAIYEIPLRSHTDLEVTSLTAAIAVTPGTQVLGIAPSQDGGPITIFVHALDEGRTAIEDEVAETEERLLRFLRPRRRSS